MCNRFKRATLHDNSERAGVSERLTNSSQTNVLQPLNAQLAEAPSTIHTR